MKKITVHYVTPAIVIFLLLVLPIITVGENPYGKQYAHFSWSDAKIRSVMNHLSVISKIDIVLDPNIEGNITLNVRNKTWKEVLDIVCKMQKLIALPEEQYIYVMKESDYLTSRHNQEVRKNNMFDVRELSQSIIKINHVEANAISKPIEGLLSKRGKLTVVDHNNSLIIQDVYENIERIHEMIKKLDMEVSQITISAKIVEVSSGEVNNLGVQWNIFNTKSGIDISHLPTDPKGSNIISSALEKATYGIISPKDFSIAMEYLFSESKTEMIAQPQITTLDNKKARLFMGAKIPVTYQDEANNTIVQMIDAGTELVVVPHITKEGRIMLNLSPTKKSYELTETGVPIINEQSAQTHVVVNDGETVVIGGLTSNEERDTEGGIPVLKDIPILGHLFKKREKRHTKKDLLIFVTPHVVKRNFTSMKNSTMESDVIVPTNRDEISIPAN